MKSNYFLFRLLPFFALAVLLAISCQKTDKSPSTQNADAQLQALLISATNDALQTGSASESQEDADGSSCKVVTYKPSKDIYPHKKIVDFGSGCTGDDGITRRGKRIIEYFVNPDSAPVGTMVSQTNYSQYYVDDIRVTGQTQSFVEVTGKYGLKVEKNVIIKRMKSPDGIIKNWTATHFVKQIEGYDTKTHEDDIFEITGSGDGNEITADGTIIHWTSKINNKNPEIKPKDCSEKIRGAIDVGLTVTAGGKGRFAEVLNYGDGTCDNKATLSINGGTPQEITLPLYFWPVSK